MVYYKTCKRRLCYRRLLRHCRYLLLCDVGSVLLRSRVTLRRPENRTCQVTDHKDHNGFPGGWYYDAYTYSEFKNDLDNQNRNEDKNVKRVEARRKGAWEQCVTSLTSFPKTGAAELADNV